MRDVLLFDIDGTLADTDALHFEAYRRLLAGHGKTIDHATYMSRVMGHTNENIMAWMMPEADIPARRAFSDAKEALFRELAATSIVPATGLMALIDWAEAKRIKFAAVTNAPRANAEMTLKALNLDRRMAFVVIGDELPRGKPDPLPYATALERFGAKAGQAMAFEDSRSGVKSAAAAGIDTVGMTTGLSKDVLMAEGAVGAVPNFADPWLIARLQAEYGSAPTTKAA
ncbi:MAG: HAD-IA family hydrolase [Alphaproteobacteria bacterium]|nr:HAD-IA family hydrolase [Alphaproteobacteria bacterium]